jgi:hypothetical protein
MDPKAYTGKEWTDLLKQMNARQIKNSMKGAIRREANNARKIAQYKLSTQPIDVQGSQSDWKKGIRARIYPKGTGFLITVKSRAANKQGQGEKSMHKNRQGLKKPILMWAEDGTNPRKTKTKTKIFTRLRKGHKTGRMPTYEFLDKATPDMFMSVETNLSSSVEASVARQAKKAGFY